MTVAIEQAVLASERLRCAAMLASDLAALDALLDPGLYFSHATGTVDDKVAYMAKMAAGRIRYIAIDWTDARVIPLGENAALLTGRMTSIVSVECVHKSLDNRVISAWTKARGDWRMAAFQSTPLTG